jgi:hypothetical protein
LEIGLGIVDWISLAQDRDKWRALVKAIMNFRAPLNLGEVSSAAELAASRVVLNSTVRY